MSWSRCSCVSTVARRKPKRVSEPRLACVASTTATRRETNSSSTTLSGWHMAGTSCAHCGIPAHKLQLQAPCLAVWARARTANALFVFIARGGCFFVFSHPRCCVFLVLFSSSSASPLYAVRYGIHSYRGEFLNEKLKPEVVPAWIGPLWRHETRDSYSRFLFRSSFFLFVISARSFKTQIYTLIRYIKMHKNIRIIDIRQSTSKT